MSVTLTPKEVTEKYGKLFCQGFLTLVDEENGVAQIVEMCIARGPMEWDVVNRKRTRGVISDIRIEGSTMIMDTVIGERELKFGPVSSELGGQGISALFIEGDTVHTRWKGLAGASVGIGACIPQASTVIRTIYPDDFKIGGAFTASVEIVTEKLVRVIVGVDDTDTPQQGASWVATMKMARECPYGKFLEHKIIQLNPKAPNKTTNCCSTAVSFAIRPDEIDKLIGFCRDFLKKETFSDDTVMTVFTGLRIPKELADWSWSAKYVLYTEDDATSVAERSGVRTFRITSGTKGVIGAVAAIGCFDMGIRSAGVPEDFE